MPTPAEQRALIFLAALGALGLGIRAFRGAPPASPPGLRAEESRTALGRQIGAVDSAIAAKRAAGGRGRSRRGAGRADTVPGADLDARARGPRRDGRAAAEAPPAPRQDPLALYEQRRLDVARQNLDAQARIERDFAGVLTPPAGTPDRIHVGVRASAEPGRARVDLDTAGSDAIAMLPWVGPVLAARIVADRDARGPFGSLAGFERVRGIGPALAAKLGQFVTFSRAGSAAESVVKFRTVRVRPKRP